MTPPPAAVVPTTSLIPASAPASRSVPHLRAVRTVPMWKCDNCETSNVARRRRCTDCGTSRF